MRELSPGKKRHKARRGRKSKYSDPEFVSALHRVRRVMEFRNAEVMKENMAEWLSSIEKHYGVFSLEIKEKLLSISASTMKLIFKKMREEAT